MFSHSIKNPVVSPHTPDLERVVCDYCGSAEATVLATLPPTAELPLPMHRLGAMSLKLNGERIQFCQCRSCGLVYMNPRLTEAAIARFYDTVYASGASTAFESDQQNRKNYLLDVTASLLKTDQPHILDIGCGAGQFLRVAQQRGWQVSGSELSGVAAATASRILGVPIYHGDFRDMPLAAGSVDVVAMQSVVEHLRAPISFLNDSAALLKPGGVLMFNVPNVASWE
jgi:SAM-dependent methyltransferase